jgi:hypothetical protein
MISIEIWSVIYEFIFLIDYEVGIHKKYYLEHLQRKIYSNCNVKHLTAYCLHKFKILRLPLKVLRCLEILSSISRSLLSDL